MADNRDSLAARAIEGGWHPDQDRETRPLHEVLRSFVRERGSQEKAAAALGIPRRTLRRWIEESLAGKEPVRPEALARRAGVESQAVELDDRQRLPEDRRSAVGSWSTVTIDAVVSFSGDDEDRTFKFTLGQGSRGLDGDAFDKMLDAYTSGDPEVFAPVVASIRDEGYRQILKPRTVTAPTRDEPGKSDIYKLRFS